MIQNLQGNHFGRGGRRRRRRRSSSADIRLASVFQSNGLAENTTKHEVHGASWLSCIARACSDGGASSEDSGDG